jgi:hypothetical protein
MPRHYNITRKRGHCKTCEKPIRKHTQCAPCARAEAQQNPRSCPECNTVSTNFARPNSTRCEGCRHRVRYERFLAKPARACLQCGVVTERVNMLMTKDVCKPCSTAAMPKTRKTVYSTNPEAVKRRRRRLANPQQRLRDNITSRLANILANGGFRKRDRTEEIVGCSFQALREHLERQFQPGMNWENYGSWHVDHIVPVSRATTELEMLELNHYTNLQPLWAADNLSKSAK